MIELIAIILSIISIFISIWAIFEAKKARILNYRSLKADKLDKYGTELYEIQNSTRGDLAKLSYEAYIAYEQSGKCLDQYSGETTGGRPVRHILYDFCSGFWEQRIHYIGNTNQLVCWHHLGKFLEIDKHPKIMEDDGRVLYAYKIFCAAIPESERQTVFNTIFKLSENYLKLSAEIRDKLEEKSQEIETLIERNAHEELKLHESAHGQKLISENLKYKELLNIGLDDVKNFTETPRIKATGRQFTETLYILLTLYIVSEYDKWGVVKTTT